MRSPGDSCFFGRRTRRARQRNKNFETSTILSDRMKRAKQHTVHSENLQCVAAERCARRHMGPWGVGRCGRAIRFGKSCQRRSSTKKESRQLIFRQWTHLLNLIPTLVETVAGDKRDGSWSMIGSGKISRKSSNDVRPTPPQGALRRNYEGIMKELRSLCVSDRKCGCCHDPRS